MPMPQPQPADDQPQPRRQTPRQLARAATLAEAKAIALRQLAEGGVAAIPLKAIAVELGLTGPAIYRYFASRNDLLTELIIDAYHDLAVAIAAAATDAAVSAQERRAALAQAYRRWALAQPHRYRLLYTAPFPGYDPNAPRLVDASREAMSSLLDGWAQPGEKALKPPLTKELSRQFRDWTARHDRKDTPELAYRAVIVWARLHGLVLLEIDGVFASLGVDADSVFEREIEILAST
jgi:AcrR family transcriptional regulator